MRASSARLFGTMTVCFATCTHGCGDPLELSQVIERTRVLGARVEVDGDPDRASPSPGETATVRWLVAEPNAAGPLEWALAACPMAPVRTGPASCAAPPFATSEGDETDIEPLLGFAVPERAAFDAEPTIAMLGAFCGGGTVRANRSRLPTGCSPKTDDSTIAGLEIPLGVDGFTNRNPSFDGANVTLNDRAWEANAPGVLPAPGASCDGDTDGLRKYRAVRSGDITLTFTDDPREALEESESLIGDTRETVALSHFSTHGELERALTFVEATDEALPVRMDIRWEPPGSVPARGRVVRFFFVLRDGRGGVDWTTRDLCVVP